MHFHFGEMYIQFWLSNQWFNCHNVCQINGHLDPNSKIYTVGDELVKVQVTYCINMYVNPVLLVKMGC